MDEPEFKLSDAVVAIIGLGLMGGSLALALRGRCRQLNGLDIDPLALELAGRMELLHTVSSDPQAVLENADLVILACPVPDILAWLERLPAYIRQACVVLDLGSSKRAILAGMQNLPLNFDPIGAHPVCGKENLSLRNAESGLYRGAPFMVMPLARTGDNARQAVQQLVQVLGAELVLEEGENHDRALAATSHLPYLLACALALATPQELEAFVGPGFRSTSRLAGTPSSMMQGVLETNRDHVLEGIRNMQAVLAKMESALMQNDSTGLKAMLDSAQERYQTLIQ
jgi:prephenate dehydrogenase